MCLQRPLHLKRLAQASWPTSSVAHMSHACAAGPSLSGGILQWTRAEGNLRRPIDAPSEQGRNGAEALTAAGEDSDCAPSYETSLQDTKKARCPALLLCWRCQPAADRCGCECRCPEAALQGQPALAIAVVPAWMRRQSRRQ